MTENEKIDSVAFGEKKRTIRDDEGTRNIMTSMKFLIIITVM